MYYLWNLLRACFMSPKPNNPNNTPIPFNRVQWSKLLENATRLSDETIAFGKKGRRMAN